jgi:dTDP-glucose 4,6-dehydratase
LYVLDHCDAIYTVLERGDIGQTYNVGGNNEIKNIDVIEAICDILDHLIPKGNSKSYKKLIRFVQDRPGHDFRYAIDASKLNSKLGWFPKESFESGLEKTIQWYINNKGWWTAILDNTYRQERLGVM